MSELSGEAIVFLKLVAIGALVSLGLVWASAQGLRRLWIIGLSTAVIACLASIAVPSVELYSYYCGPLCGEGWELSPFGIASSSIATAAVVSPAAIRKRRLVCVAIGWIISTVFLVPGLSYWIA